jgi:hypothetical protein
MTVEQVRSVLAANRDELAALGGASLSVFGSTARGEADADSDVDLLVDLNRRMGLFDFFAIRYRLEELLGCRVDLVQSDGLGPRVRERVLKEAVRAA